MKFAIISDSSSDLLSLDNVTYACVPLKVITEEKEYIDDKNLDLAAMLTELKQYKGVSKSSCPNAAEWKEAFGDADGVFCVTITSGLSGSCNAAHMALSEYLQEHPERKGYVVDSLSAGPEVALLVEKLAELMLERDKEGRRAGEVATFPFSQSGNRGLSGGYCLIPRS